MLSSVSVCGLAIPRVRYMSRSHTVVAGSQLELHCRVWGWPLPRVTWHRLSSPFNFSADWRLSLRPGVAMAPRGIAVDNATLVIADVTYADRDMYVCDVTSYVDGSWRSDNGTVFVRVKGQTITFHNVIIAEHSTNETFPSVCLSVRMVLC